MAKSFAVLDKNNKMFPILGIAFKCSNANVLLNRIQDMIRETFDVEGDEIILGKVPEHLFDTYFVEPLPFPVKIAGKMYMLRMMEVSVFE